MLNVEKQRKSVFFFKNKIFFMKYLNIHMTIYSSIYISWNNSILYSSVITKLLTYCTVLTQFMHSQM